MYNSNGLQRYREADINSMTKEKMIILLYEKVESDLESAISAIGNNDLVEMTRLVNHSQRIICELRSALDHSIGGEISQNLESLYDYMFHEHLEVVIDHDPIHLDNCIRVLHPLLDSWRKVPPGTCEKAARNQSLGLAQNANGGPERATESVEAPEKETAAPNTSSGAPAEPVRTLSFSV